MRPMKVWQLPIREGTDVAEARVPWPLTRREFRALLNYLTVAWNPCIVDEEAPEEEDGVTLRWYEEVGA